MLPCPPPGDLPDPGIESAYVSCIGRQVLYHGAIREALGHLRPGSLEILISRYYLISLPARVTHWSSFVKFIKDFPGASGSKESACNPGYWCSIPGLRRSPEEGNGNLLQYSCLENSIDRGAWWTTVHGVVGHD